MAVSRNLTKEQLHARYCPVKNPRAALFLVGCFSLLVLLAWTDLHKPAEQKSLIELPFAALVVAACANWMVAFRCFRERVVLGIVIVTLTAGEITGLFSAINYRSVELIRFLNLILEGIGLLVSLSLLVSATRKPNIGVSSERTSGASQIKRAWLAPFVLVLGILLLGTLLYLWPLR